MLHVAPDLEDYLAEFVAHGRRGDRLPPVRDLMKRHGLSQAVVQRAIHRLREHGVVEVHTGKGIFLVADGSGEAPAQPRAAALNADGAPGAAARARSVLVLRRAVRFDRGRQYIEQLGRRFMASGHKLIEVSYSDAEHAQQVLKGLPRFDACVIQSVYHAITSGMLATLQEKTPAVLYDGIAMVGNGFDSIGTEWGEPLALAAALLHRRGHQRLCFAATSVPLLSTTLGFRRWAHLAQHQPGVSLQTIRLPFMPDEGYVEALVAELRALQDADGRLPFSALIVWGIWDGARFRQMLEEAGVSVPGALSVVLLGRTDQQNEHADFFEVVGARIEDQVAMMFEATNRRWADPTLPFGAELAPVTHRPGASVAAPAERAVATAR
ncbi:hypothetical protein RD110_00250 [Rhodoferax koreense]|uniref:HTH gntR-type domain-containing protein n=1 Tax=Rhodoferax koreensis TaxID=1842727 RepID=A0A1P8JPZ5_9BURK|nr:GntR family transcriptional regulator [Rhodoferax koreense]APW35837.1 hypothetical protein RD110_00250 [Rhodoferax koreense]